MIERERDVASLGEVERDGGGGDGGMEWGLASRRVAAAGRGGRGRRSSDATSVSRGPTPPGGMEE